VKITKTRLKKIIQEELNLEQQGFGDMSAADALKQAAEFLVAALDYAGRPGATQPPPHFLENLRGAQAAVNAAAASIAPEPSTMRGISRDEPQVRSGTNRGIPGVTEVVDPEDNPHGHDLEFLKNWDPAGDRNAYNEYHKLECNRGWGPEGEEKHRQCAALHPQIDPRALGEY